MNKRRCLCLIWLLFNLMISRLVAQNLEFRQSLYGENILCLEQDRQGYIWAGTEQGLFRYNGFMFQAFRADSQPNSLNSDYITNLLKDRNGNLWLTNDCGLLRWDGIGFQQPSIATYSPVVDIVDVNDSTLVLKRLNGIELVSKKTFEMISQKTLSPNWFGRIVYASIPNEIWLHINNEIQIYDTTLKLLQRLSFPSNIRQMVYDDAADRMWVTDGISLSSYHAKSREEIPLGTELMAWETSHRNILFIRLFGKNELLIGVEHDKMYRYNTLTDKVSPIDYVVSLSSSDFSCCLVDKDKNIWLANNKGFLQFYPYHQITKTIFLENTLQILDIQTDASGNIWVLTNNTLICFDKKTHQQVCRRPFNFFNYHLNARMGLFAVPAENRLQLYNVSPQGISESTSVTLPFTPRFFFQDNQRKMWVASEDRIGYLGKNNDFKAIPLPSNIRIKNVVRSKYFAKIYIVSIDSHLYEWDDEKHAFNTIEFPVKALDFFCDDEDGNFWLCTFNEGLVFYNPKTKEKKRWDASIGLPKNHVKNIVIDRDKNVWVSSDNYIARLTPSTNRFIYVKDINLGVNAHYVRSCISDEGVLYFAGPYGITCIYPDDDLFKQMEQSAEVIPLYLDKIEVEGTNYTDKYLENQQLRLKYNENTIRIYFSGIRYEQGSFLNYSYMLQGYDENWIESGTVQFALYSSLPPGDYVFKARVKNLNGTWSSSVLEIPIHVSPIIWLSAWAKMAYTLLLILVAVALVRLYIRRKMSDQKLNLIEREKEMAQEQIDFLANLSHELHTPLTLVNAPLTQLQHSGSICESDRVLVNLALKSAENIKKLSDQILETGKNDHRVESKLKVAEGYLPSVVKTMVDNFRFIAAEQEIRVEMEISDTIGLGYFDQEKIEKILSNLLSNAIKYSAKEKGELLIHTYLKDGHAFVSVRDNGKGISPEKQKELFQRYNRLSMEHSEIVGNGVGLNYSLYLAHLHHGNIEFRPREMGGSVFTLSFPYWKEAYEENEIDSSVRATLQPAERQHIVISQENGKTHTVLVVEDNSDVRKYMRQLFAQKYNVLTAADGVEAMEHLEAGVLPDVVISDVIMPRKDGHQLCKEIRNSSMLTHLPVILLTARDTTENHLKSLNQGADAYLPKPFDPYVLLSQVENLIKRHRELQLLLASKTSSTLKEMQPAISGDSGQEEENTPAMVISKEDQKFLNKLYGFMDEHLNDNDYTVALLSRDIGMSFNTLSSRMKLLLGETPHSFINTYRMNKALEMLRSGMPVSEVCYSVGASAIQNFSRSFKAKFGVPPSQYDQL